MTARRTAQDNQTTPAYTGSRVTQQDIAARCGVTRVTVSMVMRNDPQIPPSTAERIRTVARELGYHPAQHHAARRLVAQRYSRRLPNQAILVVLPKYYHRALYFSRIIEGIQDEFAEEGYLMLTAVQPFLTEDSIPPLLAGGDFDGVLYYGSDNECQHMLRELRLISGRLDIPVISLLQPNNVDCSVLADEQQGTALAIGHLLAQGHRHLLACVHGEVSNYPRREAGVKQAFADAGISPEGHLFWGTWYLGDLNPPHHLDIASFPYETPEEQAFIQAQFAELGDFIRAHPQITAITAMNDPLARRIAFYLRREGFRIPEDISLIGFDDTDRLINAHGENELTTISSPLREVGATAARLLIDHVAKGTPLPAQVMLPMSLVTRCTTTPPRP